MEQTLNINLLKIAKEELREDEETRNNALNQMQLWLKQNNKIIHSRSGKYYFDLINIKILSSKLETEYLIKVSTLII